MTWNEIKTTLKKELTSKERKLADPSIRLRALDRIEALLDKQYISNPLLFLSIDKSELKEKLGKKKELNSAEISIINHIYSVLNGEPIPMRKKSS